MNLVPPIRCHCATMVPDEGPQPVDLMGVQTSMFKRHWRVREMATRILHINGDHDPLGRTWVSNFLSRQPRVASVVGRSIDALRAEAASPAQILAFLELFNRVRIELGIRVEDI